jgi:DNA repair photolyase
MEQKMSIKENAVELLEKQLAYRANKGQYGFIVLASATEPYLQVEMEIGLTRKLLEVICRYRFPVHIITRSDMIERDFDLLHQIDKESVLPPDLVTATSRKVFITFSFSSLDPHVCSVFEPGATGPQARLHALQKCLREGFHAGVSLMPLLPAISDSQEELDNFYATFSSIGAKYLMPASITLFGDGHADSKTLTLRAVEKFFPERLTTYKQVLQSGFKPSSAYISKLNERIQAARDKHPINDRIISIN